MNTVEKQNAGCGCSNGGKTSKPKATKKTNVAAKPKATKKTKKH